jgi:CPA2 family monovalent cation:H+ antiporter-2
MEHSLPLISTLVIAFTLALVLGYAAERIFRAPALVGYLAAGIAAGEYTPGVFADPELAEQLSEIGVMLLMFGVGLHFSFGDLLKVKGIAVPGAVLQMAIATLLGGTAAHFFWGWHWGAALVLGLCLSCASTVVLIKALEVRGILSSRDGQIAVGWLVVEDIATVVILVLLPVLAGLSGSGGQSLSAAEVLWLIAKTLFNVAAFIALMLLIGRRVLPLALGAIARTGSRELFTLFILAAALGVAYGAAGIFSVSFALGAFFAGAVMRESSLAHRAASETLPFQDAFSVLFFVGVGMMFDWHILVESPLELLTVLAVILIGKSLTAFALVHFMGYPLRTSLTVGAALAQIGEFSFILVVQAQSLGLADKNAVNLIVGAAILSIALNPVLFSSLGRARALLTKRWEWARRAARREEVFRVEDGAAEPAGERSVLVVGSSPAACGVMRRLSAAGVPVCGLVHGEKEAAGLREGGIRALTGSGTDAQKLLTAGVMNARLMVIFETPAEALRIAEIARTLNAGLPVTAVGGDEGLWKEVPEKSGLHFICPEEAAVRYIADTVRSALENGTGAGTPAGRRAAAEG